MSPIITVTLNPTIDRILEVPGLRLGDHARVRLRARRAAGKGVNVSRTLAALGVENTAFGFAGRESLAWFEAELRAAGVTPHLIPLRESSRENITLIDPQARIETHLRETGPKVSPGELAALRKALSVLVAPGAVVVFTGSCPPGIDAAAFGQLIDLVLARGARAAVDTSGEPLREAARRPLWLLKINQAELSELVGEPLPDDRAVRSAMHTLNGQIARLVVTLGARGALLMHANRLIQGRVELPPERVRSTVGCGDAFLGGWLAGQQHPADDVDLESLSLALAAGSASAMSELPADFDLTELRRFRSQAILDTIETRKA